MKYYCFQFRVRNKKGKLIFTTKDLFFLNEKIAQESLKEFRGCIKKSHTITVHKIETHNGVEANKVKFFGNETRK